MLVCWQHHTGYFDVFLEGMPKHDYYILPVGIFILMITSPFIYILAKDFLDKKGGSNFYTVTVE